MTSAPGTTVREEFRIRHADGTFRVMEGTATNHFGESGIDAVVANYRDITDRRQAQRELRLFESSIKSVSDIAIITDLRDRWVFVNDAFLRTYGYRRDEVIGRHVGMIWSRRNLSGLGRRILRAMRAGGWKGEIWTVGKDGKELPVELSTSQVRDDGGRLLGRIAIARDITERREADRVQSALYRIAETASAVDDLPQFYRAIHGIVGELMNARNFYIALRDPATGALKFPYFADEEESSPPQIAAGGLTEYVLRSGEPLLPRRKRSPPWSRKGASPARARRSTGSACLSARRGDIWRARRAELYPDRRFREQDQDILMFVSRHIASALERKRSAEALRDANEFRERVLEARPMRSSRSTDRAVSPW